MFCVSDNTFGIYFLRSFSLLILKGKICFAFLITEKNGNRTPQKMSMSKAPAQRVSRNRRKGKPGDLCPGGALPACPLLLAQLPGLHWKEEFHWSQSPNQLRLSCCRIWISGFLCASLYLYQVTKGLSYWDHFWVFAWMWFWLEILFPSSYTVEFKLNYFIVSIY